MYKTFYFSVPTAGIVTVSPDKFFDCKFLISTVPLDDRIFQETAPQSIFLLCCNITPIITDKFPNVHQATSIIII